jgi:AcrR family transcriptional regulator
VAAKDTVARGRGRPRAFSSTEALMAAVAVFAKKGYEHTSLSDLTSAMGINRTSMYLAFGSKEDLFLLAMKEFQAQADAHLTECMSGASARAGMGALLRSWAEMVTSPDGLGVCFITQAPLTDVSASAEVAAEIETCRASVQLKLKERFDQAVIDGELPARTDTGALGRFYSVTIQGLALDAQHGGTREQLLGAADVALSAWPGLPGATAAGLTSAQVLGRAGDDRVESFPGADQCGDLAVDMGSLRGEPFDQFRGGLAVDDAGQEVHDHLARQVSGKQLLNQPDAVDRAFQVEPLATGAPFRGKQILFFVVAKRPDAHASPRGQLADAHQAPCPVKCPTPLASYVSVRF